MVRWLMKERKKLLVTIADLDAADLLLHVDVGVVNAEVTGELGRMVDENYAF